MLPLRAERPLSKPRWKIHNENYSKLIDLYLLFFSSFLLTLDKFIPLVHGFYAHAETSS